MSIVQAEIEIVDRSRESIRYLQHGWPSELCRWHSHREYELHLITETRGKAFVGDYIGDFKPGALYLTGPNLPHNWITDDVWAQEVPIRDMLVQFRQSSMDAIMTAFPEFSELKPMLDLAQSGIEFVGFDPKTAVLQMEKIRELRGVERVVALLHFLVLINKNSNKTTLSVSKLMQPEGGKKARIGKVIDYIVNNFADEISVKKAAAMTSMSPTTFSRNFQSVTGHTFVEFVNRIRIGQACSMLYATNDQVSSICFDVGFQNLANFNRHFLRIKNMTPSAYRQIAQTELAHQSKEIQ